MYNLYNKIKLKEDLYDKEDLELLLTNTFKFTRKYDMEFCPTPVLNDPINWELVPFDDVEWRWVLHRMDYCESLCIHSVKTGDLKYIKHAKKLIFNFIEQNNEQNRSKTLRTLDSGIRLTVWSRCIKYFNQFNLLSIDEFELICRSINWQVKHLVDEYLEFHDFSNWGFMQAVGVLNCAYITNIDDEILSFYEERYFNHLNTQFFENGIQWEQSSVYTVEVAIRMLQMSNPCYRTERYYEVLKKAAKAIYSLGNFDDKTILFGDGDRIDTIGFVQEVAYITRDEKLIKLVAGTTLREEVYFNHGDASYAYYNSIKKPEHNDIVHEYLCNDSGFYSCKSSNNYLSLQNGTLGGGHGHLDNLHVNFSLDKQKILVDCGRYTYVEKEERGNLKEVFAHNGICLEKNNLNYVSSWETTGKFSYTPIYKKTINNIQYIETSTHSSIANSFRKLIYLETGELIIIDTCSTNFTLNFTTDYSNKISETSNGIDIGNCKATFYNASTNIEDTYMSPKYNVIHKTQKIKVTSETEMVISCFTKSTTKVSKSTDIEIFQVQRYLGELNKLFCCKIETETQSYVLAILPYEYGANNNILMYRNKLIQGSVVLIKNENQHIVLKR